MKLMTLVFTISIISFTFAVSSFIWELLSGFQFVFYTEILMRVGLIVILFLYIIFALMVIVKEAK